MEEPKVPREREKPASYLERLDELLPILREHGGLGAILVDLTPLSQVELSYGTRAYVDVVDSATKLILELSGNEVRGTDVFASNDRGGDGFLVILSPPERGGAARLNELEGIAARVENYVNNSLTRLGSPYLHGRTRVVVGYGLVLQNPLISPERLVSRLVQDAWECVRLARSERQFRDRCLLQELLIHQEVGTVYQPIVDMEAGQTMGFEALSRGPEGTDFQSPLDLFATAEEGNLAFELDRLCRQKALENAKGLPPEAMLFVNVLPSSMYDPALQGEGLLRVLEKSGLQPRQLVFELTETYVIENYSLFGNAVRQFTELGIHIGIDDIGAGYSALERIAWLHPKYLKFDIGLIRHVDTSYVRREMVRALKALADKMGSTVIAEGIERREELETLLELGITYGQGFLLGRPERQRRWRVGPLELEERFWMCSKIFRMTFGSVMKETMRIFPPQFLQISGSVLTTRRIQLAHWPIVDEEPFGWEPWSRPQVWFSWDDFSVFGHTRRSTRSCVGWDRGCE